MVKTITCRYRVDTGKSRKDGGGPRGAANCGLKGGKLQLLEEFRKQMEAHGRAKGRGRLNGRAFRSHSDSQEKAITPGETA